MLTKITRKAECKLAELREERGATDPILVIAAIAVSLVLLVGGSFAVSGIITNGQNLNAQGDLDKVGVAEVATFAEGDTYLAYDSTAADGSALRELEDSGIGFTPTEGGAVQVIVSDDGWIAKSLSVSGEDYFKASESNKIHDTFAQALADAPASLATTVEADFTIVLP